MIRCVKRRITTCGVCLTIPEEILAWWTLQRGERFRKGMDSLEIGPNTYAYLQDGTI